jgi:YesN/AraC family two-component response regulator
MSMKQAIFQQPKNNAVGVPCVRVLICDDEPRIREGLKSLLSTSALSKPGDTCFMLEVVGTAADGREAIQIVEEYHPDVVLMDARMPELDGFEATRIIKSRWPQVKVIMLTMYSEHQTAAVAAGVDAFQLKGCPAELLLDTIIKIYQLDAGPAHN